MRRLTNWARWRTQRRRRQPDLGQVIDADQVGRPAARFDGDPPRRSVPRCDALDGTGVVRNRAVAQLFSLLVQNADLHRILVVIKSDKNW